MHEIQQFPPLAIVPSFEPQPESAPGALKDKGSAPSTCDLKPRQKCVRVPPKVSGEWIDPISPIFVHFHDRNLCALRWLKQTKPGGTTVEFSN
jgi:hypothetical protein